jgi:glycosyltransferase involved in cell wall biosynthesis
MPSDTTIQVKTNRRSRRKAIFVNRFYFPDESATSQMLTDIARGLAGADIDIVVVTSRQLYDAPDTVLEAYEHIDGVEVNRVWTSRFGRARLIGRAIDYAAFYVTATWRLLWLLRHNDILIVKTDPPMLSILGAIVARLRGAVLINWLQDVFPEVATQLSPNLLPQWVAGTLRNLRDRSLRFAYCNVVLGERMREHLLSSGVAMQKIAIIENWADDTAIAPQIPDATRLRKSNGLVGKFVVAYSGNLGRAHEYHTFLQAAQVLRAEVDIVFLMIGGGAQWQPLRAAVDYHQLSNFVFMPYQPRESLADSLSAADIHLISLLPTLEGLIVPSKFYGIIAAGRPAIFIGDLDGELARKIRRADCGAVVGIARGNELAAVLSQLRAEPERVKAQGVRARQLFERQHTLSHAVDKWRQLIQSL